MIIDGLLVFDNSVAITVTRDSTNVLDMLSARDMGVGDSYSLKLAIWIPTAFTAGGAATLTIAIQGSADNVTYYTLAQSRAMAVADLTVRGPWFPIDLPAINPNDPLPRYYKLVYTVATGPMLTGAIFAALVLDNQQNRAYPAGINIAN